MHWVKGSSKEVTYYKVSALSDQIISATRLAGSYVRMFRYFCDLYGISLEFFTPIWIEVSMADRMLESQSTRIGYMTFHMIGVCEHVYGYTFRKVDLSSVPVECKRSAGLSKENNGPAGSNAAMP